MEKTVGEQQAYSEKIPEGRKVISLYLAFFGSLALAAIPSIYTAALSLIFLSFALLSLYRTRRHAKKNSLGKTHAHFLIRTFWNGNIIFMLSFVLSILYFLMFVRLSSLNPCVEAFLMNWEYLITSVNPRILLDFLTPCEKSFTQANQTTMQSTAFIAFSPVLLYLLSRFVRGWTHVIKNKNI